MKHILYYGLALPAISLLAWLFWEEYRGGSVSLKQTSSRIRLVSLTLFLLLSVIDVCTGPGEVGYGSALLNLQMSAAVLLLSPHSYEKDKRGHLIIAGAFASVCALTELSLVLSGASAWKSRLFPVFAVSCLILHNCLRLRRRFSNVKTLFQNRAAWYSIEDYASHCYALLLISSICLVEFSSITGDVFSMGMLIPSLVLAGLSVYGAYRKSVDSTIIFLSGRQCQQIQNIMTGDVVERSARTQARRKAMFGKIEKYLTERQPYLDESFTIVDLADAMLSNRVYISKTINKVTGNNFCRLINTYRVEYSQRLWKMNPGLRLKEIYSRCGFNNMPSFIKAFKDITGHTPVEWLKETQAEKLRNRPAGKKLAA